MTTLAPAQPPTAGSGHGPAALGPVGRLGHWSATHARWVFIVWAIVVIGLGVLAPRVETALSGAGWEDSGSQSVAARSRRD